MYLSDVLPENRMGGTPVLPDILSKTEYASDKLLRISMRAINPVIPRPWLNPGRRLGLVLDTMKGKP